MVLIYSGLASFAPFMYLILAARSQTAPAVVPAARCADFVTP